MKCAICNNPDAAVWVYILKKRYIPVCQACARTLGKWDLSVMQPVFAERFCEYCLRPETEVSLSPTVRFDSLWLLCTDCARATESVAADALSVSGLL
jgi:hypothetical protein